MTSLSQYLRAELPDRSEPVSFYIPGASSWFDPRLRALRRFIVSDLDVTYDQGDIALENYDENE